MKSKIAFLDLITPHMELEEELVSVFRSSLRSAGFIGGPVVVDFEREFAQFCDTQHCVGVNSGTDALRFALIAAGIEPGTTVITVPNTFIATTEAITQAGAHLDFVDIDERTYTMDPEQLRHYLESKCEKDSRTGKLVNRRTRRTISAIIPVHLYGQPADMDPILELARRYGLIVIEDACQAHGAEYFSEKEASWKKAGTMGLAAAFSFYPGKNLGACGEAGALNTNDPAMASIACMLRDHGQSRKYYHDIEGYNGRLDAIQAGILRVKLKYLAKGNENRRKAAALYNDLLSPLAPEIGLPSEPAWSRGVFHLYVIRTRKRDELRAYLDANGIGTGIHYPVPLHVQKAYQSLGYQRGDFPVTERTASEILSLPMFPHLSLEQQREVADCIHSFLHSSMPAAHHTDSLPVSRT